MVALRGMAEDDVEDHLESGSMDGLHHGLELGDLAAGTTGPDLGRIARVRREQAQAVVAPVVGEAPGPEIPIVDVVMDRHQLHGCDAQARQVIERGGGGEAGIGAAHIRRDAGMQLGETLDVNLIEHAVGVGDGRRRVGPPVEAAVHDEAPRHVRRRVQDAEPVRRPRHVAEDRVDPVNITDDGPGVRIQKELVRVAAEAPGRFVRTRYAVPVALAGADGRHETVPYAGVLLL
jgi:hypothetical protein